MRDSCLERYSFAWIDAALSLQDFRELIGRIAADTSASICFREAGGMVFVVSRDPEFIENVEAYPLQELFRHYAVDLVTDNDSLLGYLVTKKEPPLTADSNIRKSVLLAIKIHALRRRSTAERCLSLKSDILQRLLTRNTQLHKILEECEGKVFLLEGGSLVAVIGFPKRLPERSLLEDRALAALDKRFARFFRRYMSWHEKQRLVIAVTPQFPMDEEAVCGFIVQTIGNIKEISDSNSSYEDIRMGVGSCKEELHLLPDSYEEACRAFQVAVLDMGMWWRTWKDLGSFRLLSIFAEHPESDLFIQNALGELARKNLPPELVVLLDTLRELDRNAWNLKSTSVIMRVHYNTLKYRYHRIQEVLEIDLNDASARFNLSFAVKLLAMKGR